MTAAWSAAVHPVQVRCGAADIRERLSRGFIEGFTAGIIDYFKP
jgi:hypothetical protein